MEKERELMYYLITLYGSNGPILEWKAREYSVKAILSGPTKKLTMTFDDVNEPEEEVWVGSHHTISIKEIY